MRVQNVRLLLFTLVCSRLSLSQQLQAVRNTSSELQLLNKKGKLPVREKKNHCLNKYTKHGKAVYRVKQIARMPSAVWFMAPPRSPASLWQCSFCKKEKKNKKRTSVIAQCAKLISLATLPRTWQASGHYIYYTQARITDIADNPP